MAKKKKESLQPTKEDFRSAGFFGKIKLFFQNIAAKIMGLWAYARGKLDTPTDGEVSGPENAQRKWASSSEIIEYTQNFPGYEKLSMIGKTGLIRIDPQAIAWHPLSDKKHYIDTIHKKFPEMPNPIETHNGEFIGIISSDIFKGLRDGGEQTFVYAIADNLISAECKDGQCILTIGNGETEHSIVLTEDSNTQSSIAKLFTEHIGTPEKISFLIDERRNISYAQWKNDAGSYDTYTIQNYHPHWNNYEDKAGIKHDKPVDSIVEIKGPDVFPRGFIDGANKITTEYSTSDFFSMITAMHETIFKNPGYQSTFVTQDKVFWLTQEGDTFVAHVAPTNCRHDKVPTVHEKIHPKALEFSKAGRQSLSKTFDRAIQKLEANLEELDKLKQQSKDFIDQQNQEQEEPPETPPEENMPPDVGEEPDDR